MTKQKSTKRAFLMSALSLLMCVSMLIGSTFAWFTDSVTSGNNKIVAGNLDIALYKTEVNMEGILTGNPVIETEITDSSEPLFGEDIIWEPGYEAVANLKIENKGNLALKWQAVIRPTSEIGKLAEVIDVYVLQGEMINEGNGRDYYADKLTSVGTLKDVLSGSAILNGALEEAGDVEFFTIVLKMQETAGNEYQGKTAGAFDITILATQYTYEADSFDDQYDKNAGYDYGKTNVGPYALNVLPNGVASWDEETKTYTITVDTVAQGGWNEGQGAYFAGYTVDVTGYGKDASMSFERTPGAETTKWTLADEEKDGFITGTDKKTHQQWTAVGSSISYRYDIDGDGVTDFTVVNDASEAYIEVATAVELEKVIEQENVSAILRADIAIDNALTVSADADVVLDMNGHTLSATYTEAKATCAIENKGALTVKNGIVTYVGVGDMNYGYGTNTINNSGALVIDGANIINTTDSGSSNAIDNAPGSTLVVESGVIESEKITIRLRDGSTATINGGTITGTRAVQIHLIHGTAADTKLTINGGTFNGEYALYSYAYGNCTFERTTVEINDGVFNGIVAFGGGNKTATETVTVNGGTFNGDLGRYLANDGWEDISKN